MRVRPDYIRFASTIAAGLTMAAVAALVSMILIFAAPALSKFGVGGVFSWVWAPYEGRFGILPMLAGSLVLSTATLFIAWPASVAAACWRLAHRGAFAARAFHAIIRFMTAIPTVVYGFAALFLLTPLVREALGGSGLCLLSTSLTLTLLIIPTMVLVLESALEPRLDELCPGGLALGMTRLELLWHFVFPASKKPLLAAALLGFGRAIGDTLLPLMLSGNSPHAPLTLTDSLRTLTAHMSLVTANEVGGSAYNSLFAAGAFLFVVNALVSLVARKMVKGRWLKSEGYKDEELENKKQPAVV
ncbi:MAG: ABC transporter permease subunit [Spirochaetaceae bacterium]|jgi:phosphate transport system permease protein|nr:ABC transporter permease subunit [Spirochaetaceae bacterium]